jgi:hypothetical protein
MVLKRILGPKSNDIIGGWGKLHDDEPNNLYSLPNTIRMMKSKRMRWAGHVERMGQKGNSYRILVANQKERDP